MQLGSGETSRHRREGRQEYCKITIHEDGGKEERTSESENKQWLIIGAGKREFNDTCGSKSRSTNGTLEDKTTERIDGKAVLC